MEVFNKAISLDPGYAEAYNNLGVLLKEQDRLEEAEASYRQAISLESNYAEAYSNLGNVLFAKGKLGESIESSLLPSLPNIRVMS